jgi:hypothetical protein
MFFRLNILPCIAVLAVVPSAARGAEPSPTAPPSQVVVLRNGNYLEGSVRPENGGYRLSMLGGGEIFLPRDEVDFVARDLEHGYCLKCAATSDESVREQIALAEWCLRHRLLSHAADHLLRAMCLDPVHPKIALVEHRLRLAAEQRALSSRSESPQAVASKAKPAECCTAETGPMLAELPAATVPLFAATVQPVLLNRCASAACHGSAAANQFRLTRPTRGERISRRMTMRNLGAAIGMLDRESPRRSPLLTIPSGPHGPLKHGLFAPHEREQFERLATWADLLASGSRSHAAAAVPAGQHLLQRLPDCPSPHQWPATGKTRDGFSTPGNPFDDLSPPDGPVRGMTQENSRNPRSVSELRSETEMGNRRTGQVDGKDPFDPAPFNQRYHASSGKSPSENSPR